MAHLKSLTFTVAPQQIARNPKLVRRQRLIDRLEEQQKLAADPAFTILVRRWVKDPDGIKQQWTLEELLPFSFGPEHLTIQKNK